MNANQAHDVTTKSSLSTFPTFTNFHISFLLPRSLSSTCVLSPCSSIYAPSRDHRRSIDIPSKARVAASFNSTNTSASSPPQLVTHYRPQCPS